MQQFIQNINPLRLLLEPKAMYQNGARLKERAIRGLFNKFVDKCDVCGDRLDNLVFKRNKCPNCIFLSKIFNLVIKAASMKFDMSPDNVISFFKESKHRRGLRNVLRAIAKKGISKPIVADFPFLVVWEVTSSCNLDCTHCHLSGRDRVPDLSPEDASRVVDILADNGTIYLSFTGGEPLLRRDIFDLIAQASGRDMYTCLATNGTLMTREKAKKLRDSGIWYVEISLDGSKQIHDSFRGDGTYERTVKAIEMCLEQEIPTGIATTITSENLDQVDFIIDFSQEIGAHRNVFFNLIPSKSCKECLEDISPTQREGLLEKVYSLATSGLNVVSTAPQFSRVGYDACKMNGSNPAVISHFAHGKMQRDSLNDRNLLLLEFIGGCGAGRSYMSLSASGDIQPCVFVPETLGNIIRDDVKLVWDQNEMLNYLRNRENLTGPCSSCKHSSICGGCRARAYFLGQGIMGSDPGCKHFKAVNQISRDIQTIS